MYLPSDCESWEKEAAETFVDKIVQSCGVELQTTDKEQDKQIRIGKSFLSDEQKKRFDFDAMGATGYSIENWDRIFIITANNGYAIEEALEHFISEVITEEMELVKSCSYVLSADSFEADVTKHINVSTVTDTDTDIYRVPQNLEAGYRYGPSFIVNEDKTVDAWFASGGSSVEQWDWIVYKHFDGKEWSEEKCVLQPTPNALDHYSCCDPGAIYTNGYYYLGYTSTLNENQADNNLFVARSKNPDGPFEKWNGEGWGGNDPVPLVYFSEDQSLWGIGEASFVELNGTLYIYYTVSGSNGHSTAVATADATDENWPLTMEFKGYALTKTTSDAIDVKYVDEYKKFIAVASDDRLTKDSYIVFYESLDGLSFEITDICKKDILQYCHNPGISGSLNGHITPGMDTFIAYAYGPKWGVWNTRYQPIELSLGDKPDISEKMGENRPNYSFVRDTRSQAELDYVGISAQTNCVLRVPSNRSSVILYTAACTAFHDSWRNLFSYRNEIEAYGYDESVIKRKSDNYLEFEVVGVGETVVTVEFRGHLTQVCVVVYEAQSEGKVSAIEPFGTYRYDISPDPGNKYEPQIKTLVYYDNGKWEMIWSTKEYDIEYEYDTEKISVDNNSHIIPKENGTHTITVKYGGCSYDITVNVSLPDLSRLSFGNEMNFEDLIDHKNNTQCTVTDNKKLLCKVTSYTDPYINIDYSMGKMKAQEYTSLTLKYMIPRSNALSSYESQIFFACNESAVSEENSQRAALIKDGKYHEITFELSGSAYWQGDINKIRLDFFDECEKEDVFYIESITLNK
ncbi:MAG: hypothetical protein IKU52_02050 [Clostridia bacterium]|nr:hypothetical protein [Clostridia bacterium]